MGSMDRRRRADRRRRGDAGRRSVGGTLGRLLSGHLGLDPASRRFNPALKWEYPYQKYPRRAIGSDKTELVYRPIVPINLVGGPEATIAYALVDTGADNTLMPLKLAELAGIDLTSVTPDTIGGIDGAPIAVFYVKIYIEIAHIKMPTLRWPALVGFHEGYQTILGQNGFLEHFRVTFDRAKKTFSFRPNNPRAMIYNPPRKG